MTNSMDVFRQQLRAHLEAQGLTVEQAAREIGTSAPTLQRHLKDGYIRSDSEARYRLWMEGRNSSLTVRQQPRLFETLTPEPVSRRQPRTAELRSINDWQLDRPLNVVDVFSGAGGLSLGFDLTRGGGLFSTVMALDVNESMVRVFNDNHPQRPGSRYRVAREVDMSDFFNEAEVLAFYLDHYADLKNDRALREDLQGLAGHGLGSFVRRVIQLDLHFLTTLHRIRRSDAYQEAWRALDSASLGQTSVIGFHDVLKMPPSAKGAPTARSLLWSASQHDGEDHAVDHALPVPTDLQAEVRERLTQLWDQEVVKLTGRSTGTGSGQLASAARKIAGFVKFLQTEVHAEVRTAWLDWRTARDSLRIHMFGSEDVWNQLQALYTADRRVSVVVGGPPCQGFSRIGRGKIRSLREQSVHVQYDAQAGDRRNHLMHQYVLFIGALAPDVFVFENVRHFQAEVKTPDGTFSAPEVLRQSIEETSHDGLRYEVAQRILDATQHCIPQTRERFFMVGVAEHARPVDAPVDDLAGWLLALPEREPVVLRPALEGLPEPRPASTPRSGGGISETIRTTLEARQGDQAEDVYINWLRQACPAGWPAACQDPHMVDAHHARVPRDDDRQFFDLMGPGRRWMDYRADDSDTVKALRETLDALATVLTEQTQALPPALQALDPHRIMELRDAADGSLSLRLLLENIAPPPGELRHHLASDGYLSKREGQHGDWLARMRADRPSKTMVSHMGKDTYAYVHPWRPRTISVREAARIQTFPDWYRFGSVGLVDAFTIVGNAVPPLLSQQLAGRVAQVIALRTQAQPVREAVLI